MTTICIEATYYAGAQSNVELPEGKKWDDIESWYVKWDTFHFKLVGEEHWQETAMDSSNAADIVDWKRPKSVTIYPVDDEGEVDYSTELAES